MNLAAIIAIKYPSADLQSEVILQDDGAGAYIKIWNLPEPQPTIIEINQWAIDLETQHNLAQTKSEKLKQIDSEWASIEKAGWDSGLGYSLGIVSTDVALLAGVYLLAKEASALGLPIPDLISMDNSIISFTTLTDMTMLLLHYGAARSAVAGSFATRRKAVEAALTIESLTGI